MYNVKYCIRGRKGRMSKVSGKQKDHEHAKSGKIVPTGDSK